MTVAIRALHPSPTGRSAWCGAERCDVAIRQPRQPLVHALPGQVRDKALLNRKAKNILFC
jgi:hypothetical protein